MNQKFLWGGFGRLIFVVVREFNPACVCVCTWHWTSRPVYSTSEFLQKHLSSGLRGLFAVCFLEV